ncbi:MAG: glycoside hydrolase family 1 protein [Parachlamydiales bacterium]|nr:glycoside hydrolase family 1 protein [Parachlamydiales bacterium]
MMVKKFMFFILFIFTFSTVFAHDWNWEQINTDDLYKSFPENFLWGSATAEYQNSGSATCFNNNWADWENTKNEDETTKILQNQKSNSATDHYNLYKEDIKLMKDFNLNSYRFSVEWSLLEPEEGIFDLDALKHYEDLIDELILNNITPMITLHHFTNPKWFQEKGSFEKEENIQYFERFAKFVFEKLSSKVKLWCTINEPAIYAFTGYVMGMFPPGEKDLQKAAEVLKNLLLAHTNVYKSLKQMPNGKNVQIGLVHNLLKFEQYSWWNLLETIPVHYLNMITTDSVMGFLKTKKFYFYIPTQAYVAFEIDDEKILDFVGLNYYSHPLLAMQTSIYEPFISTCLENEVMSDCHYRFHPEGIYKAIEEISSLNVPIYITENGIADREDKNRDVFIKRYLYSLSKAIEDGYDVRGYFYWTLVDNFEWNEGFLQKFGLFEFDHDTKIRTLKPGAIAYKKIIENWQNQNLKN